MKTVVVTGASGYIGGQISIMLHDAGYRVVGIDLRNYPSHLSGVFDRFVHNDFASNPGLNTLIQEQPDAIMHCAATSLVGPSITNPDEYYDNNVVKTLRMLDIVTQAIPRTRVIFSSSAAVYGNPIMNPCNEVDPKEPISPYGESKLMTEMILASYHKAYALDYVAFRYFNACGADPQGRHGEEPRGTHIIARILESIRDNKVFELYGNDYPTPDGTCIRDYVHVEDIARAHLLALNSKISSGVYNLGSNQGHSNHEILMVTQQVVGKLPEVQVANRREGDPAGLTASSSKFGNLEQYWRQWSIHDMVEHAWKWYNR
jgi:UDP-glucose-4-epimerase GalE